MLKKLLIQFAFAIVFVLICLADVNGQDSAALHHFKYVMLYSAKANGAAPGYSNFKPVLEAGIKKILAKSNFTVLNNQKEVKEKGIGDCEILRCTYAIYYATGLMLNAKLDGSVSFTDCNKNEIYNASAKRMAGAVAGAKSYLKLFSKMSRKNLIKI